ncbi:hypothetical protein N136_02451 [Leifsonia aquatica ATCC 14665]|uniref:Uncharacterized protein n=1 Tax=Leifsonia aquatica ATCC 14665 TaxID=1358026 RepID=U2RQT4_LEIAQ|nr:hypothetical protein N136_02451 [Leifsonia aquatica ATCC 14665]
MPENSVFGPKKPRESASIVTQCAQAKTSNRPPESAQHGSAAPSPRSQSWDERGVRVSTHRTRVADRRYPTI